MPIWTPKGYKCRFCNEVFEYESSCVSHEEEECLAEQINNCNSRLDALEDKIKKLEKRMKYLEKMIDKAIKIAMTDDPFNKL